MKGRVIAIVEATRSPGLGLVRAIAARRHDGFVARAVVRDRASGESRRLIAAGVEVVEADIADEASLRRALAGAYGAFYLFLPKERSVPPRAPVDGHAMAQAAKHAALKHVIWGMVDDTGLRDDDVTPVFADEPALQNPERAQTAADPTFAALQVPTTYLRTSWSAPVPAGPLAEEIGACAYNVFHRPELIGKTVSITEEMLAIQAAGRATAAGGASAPAHRAHAGTAPAPAGVNRLGKPGKVAAAVALACALVTVSVLAMRDRRPRALGSPLVATPLPRHRLETLPILVPEANGDEPPELAGGDGSPLGAQPSGDRSDASERRNHRPSRSRARRPRDRADAAVDARVTMREPEARPQLHAAAARRNTVSEAAAPREIASPRPPEHQTAPGAEPTRADPPSPPIAPTVAAANTPYPASSALSSPSEAATSPPVRPAGFLDPQAVTLVVRAHAAEVRACFDRALMERPELRGRLAVAATVDPSGHVMSVLPTRTLAGGARLQACVLDAFRQWTFPAPLGRVNGKITYSFSFE